MNKTDILTVGELLEQLRALPLDALVMLECSDDWYNGPLKLRRDNAITTAGWYGDNWYALGDDRITEWDKALEERSAIVLQSL